MRRTVPAPSRAAQKLLNTAAWLATLGMLAGAWGCRVKRVDPEPPPSSSAPVRLPAASAASRTSVEKKKERGPATGPIAPPKRAMPATSAAPPPAATSSAAPSEVPPLAAFAAAELPPGVAAAAFSGPGTDPAQTHGLVGAVRHALSALTQRSAPLEAAVAGTLILEADPLLNAGSGAALRLDGSAELEVLVMDSSGRLGAAAAVRNVEHPVRLAFAATSSPHHLLVGDGAQRVASWLGLPLHDRRTPRQIETYEALVAQFSPGREQRPDVTAWGYGAPGPGRSAWQAYLKPPPPEAPPAHPAPGASASAAPSSATPHDIAAASAEPPAQGSAPAVALLVRSGPGAFAGVIETGGSWLALPGSVGAIATPGAALYVASRGAVALAGPSEQLVAGVLARRTYDKLLAYQSARAAAAWALQQSGGQPISILVMDARNVVTLSNAATAWAKADPSESTSAGPESAKGAP